MFKTPQRVLGRKIKNLVQRKYRKRRLPRVLGGDETVRGLRRGLQSHNPVRTRLPRVVSSEVDAKVSRASKEHGSVSLVQEPSSNHANSVVTTRRSGWSRE